MEVEPSRSAAGTAGWTEASGRAGTMTFGQPRDADSASRAALCAPCRPRCPGSGVEEEDASGSESRHAKHPGRVIMTHVTINSLTVTFLEAAVAEGFFKAHAEA